MLDADVWNPVDGVDGAGWLARIQQGLLKRMVNSSASDGDAEEGRGANNCPAY